MFWKFFHFLFALFYSNQIQIFVVEGLEAWASSRKILVPFVKFCIHYKTFNQQKKVKSPLEMIDWL